MERQGIDKGRLDLQVYKSKDELEKETDLSRHEQRAHRLKCSSRSPRRGQVMPL